MCHREKPRNSAPGQDIINPLSNFFCTIVQNFSSLALKLGEGFEVTDRQTDDMQLPYTCRFVAKIYFSGITKHLRFIAEDEIIKPPYPI